MLRKFPLLVWPIHGCLKHGNHWPVFDNVARDGFLFMLKLLRRDDRYNSSGAFAGLIAGLDTREMYIKDM